MWLLMRPDSFVWRTSLKSTIEADYWPAPLIQWQQLEGPDGPANVSARCVSQRPPCKSGLEPGRRWPHTALNGCRLTLLESRWREASLDCKSSFHAGKRPDFVRKTYCFPRKLLALNTIRRAVLAEDVQFLRPRYEPQRA